jgi:hypothetical protein
LFLLTKSLVLPTLIFACMQESGGWSYGQICQMEGEGELCMRLCVWSKGGLEFISSMVAHLTCWWKFGKTDLSFPALKSPATRKGTNPLNSRPQLNLVMNGVAVDQVEETKLLGVTLDCKLSWSTYRFNGCKDGERSVRNKEMFCFFDTTLHKASPACSSFVLS